MKPLTPEELVAAHRAGDHLLPLADTAHLLGITPETIRTWIHRDRLGYALVDGVQHVLLSQAVEVELATRRSRFGRPRMTNV